MQTMMTCQHCVLQVSMAIRLVLLLAANAEVIHDDDDDLIALCSASELGY